MHHESKVSRVHPIAIEWHFIGGKSKILSSWMQLFTRMISNLLESSSEKDVSFSAREDSSAANLHPQALWKTNAPQHTQKANITEFLQVACVC